MLLRHFRKIKWPKSEEKPENWGRWGLINDLWLTQQKFCPLSKCSAGSASEEVSSKYYLLSSPLEPTVLIARGVDRKKW